MKTIEQIEKELNAAREQTAALEKSLQEAKAAENEIKAGDYIVCIDDTFTKDKVFRAYKHPYNDYICLCANADAYDGYYKRRFRKATREEIEKHLLKDAEARGFKVGVYVIPNVDRGYKYRIDGLKVIFADIQLDLKCDSELVRNAIQNAPFVVAYNSNNAAPIDVLNFAVEDIMVKTIDGQNYKADFSQAKDKNIVKFGCAEIPIALFKDLNLVFNTVRLAGNRNVESVQIGKGIFTLEIIKKIVEQNDEVEK